MRYIFWAQRYKILSKYNITTNRKNDEIPLETIIKTQQYSPKGASNHAKNGWRRLLGRCQNKKDLTLCLLSQNTVKQSAQCFLRGNNCPEAGETADIRAVWYPDFQIAVRSILVYKVSEHTPVMTFSVKFRIVGEAILDGASHYGLRVDKPVGLGHYEPVVIAGTRPLGGTVVFDSLTHRLDLLFRKPALHHGVFDKHLARVCL